MITEIEDALAEIKKGCGTPISIELTVGSYRSLNEQAKKMMARPNGYSVTEWRGLRVRSSLLNLRNVIVFQNLAGERFKMNIGFEKDAT